VNGDMFFIQVSFSIKCYIKFITTTVYFPTFALSGKYIEIHYNIEQLSEAWMILQH